MQFNPNSPQLTSTFPTRVTTNHSMRRTADGMVVEFFSPRAMVAMVHGRDRAYGVLTVPDAYERYDFVEPREALSMAAISDSIQGLLQRFTQPNDRSFTGSMSGALVARSKLATVARREIYPWAQHEGATHIVYLGGPDFVAELLGAEKLDRGQDEPVYRIKL